MPLIGAKCEADNLKNEACSSLKRRRLQSAKIVFPVFPHHYAQWRLRDRLRNKPDKHLEPIKHPDVGSHL
jgi:hypothetical protein